jgi:hypothetical protein
LSLTALIYISSAAAEQIRLTRTSYVESDGEGPE